MRRRAALAERSLLTTWSAAACVELGRGRGNVHKRYLIHIAGPNLGILMRHPIGAATPKEADARGRAFLFVACGDHTPAIAIFALDQAGLGMLVVTAEPT
jgi:transposase